MSWTVFWQVLKMVAVKLAVETFRERHEITAEFQCLCTDDWKGMKVALPQQYTSGDLMTWNRNVGVAVRENGVTKPAVVLYQDWADIIEIPPAHPVYWTRPSYKKGPRPCEMSPVNRDADCKTVISCASTWLRCDSIEIWAAASPCSVSPDLQQKTTILKCRSMTFLSLDLTISCFAVAIYSVSGCRRTFYIVGVLFCNSDTVKYAG